jgi:translation initiation factor 2B subunit (eIF-2B alpha/beta/delta family)/ADP-ribose pyrophosphatase YjhB (NUDIX family)
MSQTHVVTCFLRNRSEVLLLQRSESVGSYTGQWGAIAGHAEGAPDELARQEIEEETGLEDNVDLVRAGDPFSVEDDALDTEWVVHPYLFDCDSRAVEPNEETAEYEWVSPVDILHRETVPDLWESYERVTPTVDSIADDHEHGSAYLSIRALEVLRDTAGIREQENTLAWDSLSALACELRDVRPSMTVIANRVNRLMYEAEGDPDSVLSTAESEIERALTASEESAAAAADQLSNESTSVLTLSRSGTVHETLERIDPQEVYVAESRPGREGVSVAETFAETTNVILVPDAAIAHTLSTASVDAVLVGADTVLADGRVINKVGTRGTALAAAHEDVPVYAVAAADKIKPETSGDPVLEPNKPSTVYDGDAALDVLAPTFDVTPADRVTLITENGPQSNDDVGRISDRYSEYADWDR